MPVTVSNVVNTRPCIAAGVRGWSIVVRQTSVMGRPAPSSASPIDTTTRDGTICIAQPTATSPRPTGTGRSAPVRGISAAMPRPPAMAAMPLAAGRTPSEGTDAHRGLQDAEEGRRLVQAVVDHGEEHRLGEPERQHADDGDDDGSLQDRRRPQVLDAGGPLRGQRLVLLPLRLRLVRADGE